MSEPIYLYDNFPLNSKLTPEFLSKAGGVDYLLKEGLIKMPGSHYILADLPGLLAYVKERDRSVQGKKYSPNLLAALIYCRGIRQYTQDRALATQVIISALRRGKEKPAKRAFNVLYNQKGIMDFYMMGAKVVFDSIQEIESDCDIANAICCNA